jgi:hypothetical protein
MDDFVPDASKSPEFVRRHGGRPHVASSTDDVFSSVALYGRLRAQTKMPPRCPLPRAVVTAGGSVAWGPNATGEDGHTLLLGADLDVRERLADPRWLWQTEACFRAFRADAFFSGLNTPAPGDDILLPADTLLDWGIHTQYLRTLSSVLAGGVRLEYASGYGQEYNGPSFTRSSRSDNEWRDDRFRVSGLVSYKPAAGFRIRLQYSFDLASNIGDGQHSVWAGFDIDVGVLESQKKTESKKQ